MTMRIAWSAPARAQLADLYAYIAQSSEEAAESQSRFILAATENLIGFPGMGRLGRRRGTRELVVPGTPYIVAYRIHLATIEILAVIHGARRWPSRFDL
jgi:toxin ParE1/3/4